MRNLSAISWQEQITFLFDDDNDIRNNRPWVDMMLHSDTLF